MSIIKDAKKEMPLEENKSGLNVSKESKLQKVG
jgi:hypothetical protein